MEEVPWTRWTEEGSVLVQGVSLRVHLDCSNDYDRSDRWLWSAVHGVVEDGIARKVSVTGCGYERDEAERAAVEAVPRIIAVVARYSLDPVDVCVKYMVEQRKLAKDFDEEAGRVPPEGDAGPFLELWGRGVEAAHRAVGAEACAKLLGVALKAGG